MGSHDLACVHRGEGRWAGSNKVVELKKKKKTILNKIYANIFQKFGISKYLQKQSKNSM